MAFNRAAEDGKALAASRADLASAQKKRAALAAREGAAAATEDRYALWCTERDAADKEIERLTKLVAARENAIQEAARAAADAEARRQVERCRADNAAIEERYRTEVPSLICGLLTFARDAAAAAAEAHRLNAMLPPGVETIAVGDIAARDLAPVPREDIATEIQELWVNSQGIPVGDQDAVVETNDGAGMLQVNRSMQIVCTKRRFRSTTFRPAFTPNMAGYFFSGLRLPFHDRPGAMFDGSLMTLDQVAVLNVEPPPQPKRPSMPIRTELIPVDAWPPAGVRTEADRNLTL